MCGVPLLEQLLQNLILGLIQGITEWLPISSTAHLKLAGTFFGLTVTPLFNIILHLGTLAVLLFFFRTDIKNILIALAHLDFKSENGMLIPRIIVARHTYSYNQLNLHIIPTRCCWNNPLNCSYLLNRRQLRFLHQVCKRKSQRLII